MCEFCTQHGEGKRWYHNMRLYSDEVFREVNSKEGLKSYLEGMLPSFRTRIPMAARWRRRMPFVYDLIVRPFVNRRLRREHFGQIVPLEDAEAILANFTHVVRLPCICRKATLGHAPRWCFGIGLDHTDVFGSTADFNDFDRITATEAIEQIRALDREGKAHSVWTFNTPYIAGMCNCDRNCMAHRVQTTHQLAQTMFKAEYLARVNPLLCTGCKQCIKVCHFDAMRHDRSNKKCEVETGACFGCGVCRASCAQGAIELVERV